LVLERPRKIIVMALNSAKTGQLKEITDSKILRKEVGSNGFSSSPSSSSSSSASSPAAAAAAAAKAAAAAVAAAVAVSTKASAKDDLFETMMMDTIHVKEQKSAASSKTVSSLVDIPRIKTAGAPKTGTGDAKGGKIKSGGPGSYAALSGDAKDDRGILLTEKDNVHDERALKKQKNATEASVKPVAPPPQSAAFGGASDFSAARLYDAKKKCEKSGADLARIIKLKEDLEMEYVKALCTAYVDEMERDKIEALQTAAAPHTALFF
jgi:hypothetical protein